MKPVSILGLATLLALSTSPVVLAHAGHDHAPKEKPERLERSPSPAPSVAPVVLRAADDQLVVTVHPGTGGNTTKFLIAPRGATTTAPKLAVVDPEGKVAWAALVGADGGYSAALRLPKPGRYQLKFYPTGAADEAPIAVPYDSP